MVLKRTAQQPQTAARVGNRRPEPRPLLKDHAYAALKRLILTEELPPGSFLSERQLVEMLGGMSKTPIRAALERLQADGLVAISPQRGVLIRETSLQEIIDTFDIRIALEAFVVDRLAGRLTAEQQRALDENLARAEACVHAGDEAGYAELDAEFHLLLATFLGNNEIIDVIRRNRDKLARVSLRVLRRDRGRMVTSHADHSAIAGALRTGVGAEAARLMREHLEYGKRQLVQ